MVEQKIDLPKLKASILLEYGIELDETTLTIIHILHQQQTAVFEEQNKKLNDAIDNINHSQKSLQVDYNYPKVQAFWFGFGKLGLSFCLLIVAATSIYFHIENKAEENDTIRNNYHSYQRAFEFLKTKPNKNAITNFLNQNSSP